MYKLPNTITSKIAKLKSEHKFQRKSSARIGYWKIIDEKGFKKWMV